MEAVRNVELLRALTREFCGISTESTDIGMHLVML